MLAYAVMGSGRGISSVAMNTSIMEQVPQHFMGRVQNTFYFAGTALQVVLGFLVGAVAQWNLVAGFSIIGLVYAVAFLSASWPVGGATPVRAGQSGGVKLQIDCPGPFAWPNSVERSGPQAAIESGKNWSRSKFCYSFPSNFSGDRHVHEPRRSYGGGVWSRQQALDRLVDRAGTACTPVRRSP